MIIDREPRYIACPHCGEQRRVLSLRSGNTCGAVYWSDMKMEAIMLPQESLILKCDECRRYFLRYKFSPDDKVCPMSSSIGLLPFTDSLRALKQFTQEDLPRNAEVNIRLYVVHTFNNKFNRIQTKGLRPTADDTKTFVDNAKKLIALLHEDHLLTLKAELYREIGDFDACRAVLNVAPAVNDHESNLRSQILEHCSQGDMLVFKVKSKK